MTSRSLLLTTALSCAVPTLATAVESVADGQWDSGTVWSDGLAPTGTKAYLIDGENLNTPNAAGTYVFGGASLEVSSGQLQLKQEHGTSGRTGNYTIPDFTLSGGTLVFDASLGTSTWNLDSAIDFPAATTSTLRIKDGSYGTTANLNGALTGAGTIAVESNRSDANDDRAYFHLNSANSAFTGNWTAEGFDSGAFTNIRAAAASALGSGTVTLFNRGSLLVDVDQGIDGIAGIVLDSPGARLDLKGHDWTGPSATFTGNSGFATLGTATVSIDTFTVDTAQVIMNVGGATDGQIITAGDADFGTFSASLLVNIDDNPEGKTFDLVTYGGTLVNPPQVSMPPTGRLTPVIDNGTGTNDTVTLSFTGSSADLVWKGNDGGSPNAWDTSTPNFDNGGSPDAFVKWDDVLFDGTASSFTPEITGNLIAGTVTFDGATDYTLSGTGSITSGSLVKDGSSTVTILNTNSFTGTATVLDGTLQIGDGVTNGDLGAVTVDVQSPGTLAYFSIDNGLDLQTAFSGDGTIAFLGTGNINESAYDFLGDNTGFTGIITTDDARLNVDEQADVGSALIQVAEGGALYLQPGGSLGNDVEIAGVGWGETAGTLGAVRFSAGGDLTGTITLTDDAQIGSHNQSFTFTGALAESGGAHTLDIRNTNGGADPVFTFSNSSTRTGATTVSGTRLVVTTDDALGTGPVTVQSNGNNGSITRLQPEGVTLDNDITLASTAQTQFRGALHAAGDTLSTINGDVTVTTGVGNGGHLGAEGSTPSVLRLMGELNVGGGQTNIVQRIGTVEYGGGASTAYTLNVTDTARLVADGGIGSQVLVRLGISAAATLDLNGFNTTVDGVNQAAESATVTNEGAADSTLTLSSATDHTFAGSIVDGATNSVGIVKDGSSTLLLTGANTYSGTTTVSGGVLGGTGSIDSDTTVQSGATLAPGASIGTLGTSHVEFESGSTFAAEIDSSVPSADLLNVYGNVTIGSGVTLDVSDIAGAPAALSLGTVLELIDYSGGTLTGTFDGLPEGGELTAGPNTFAIAYDDADFVTLTVVAGSDPFASWAMTNITDIDAGAPAGFEDDADGDGIDNGLEWILGGDPLAQDADSLVATTGDATDGLTLVFGRNADSIGEVSLNVEWDTDLTFGNSLSIGTVDVGPSGDNPTIDLDAPTPGEVTVNIPAANATDGRLFARIRATMP